MLSKSTAEEDTGSNGRILYAAGWIKSLEAE
jgi:hypothetical protein